jgi:hypothetical protein
MLRSSFALTTRKDIPALGVSFRNRVSVLLSGGGNAAVPGAFGPFQSSVWFSNNVQGMLMTVVGGVLTFTPVAPFSNTVRERNPVNTIFADGKDTQISNATTVLRFVNPNRDRFVEFGADNDGPYMILYSATDAYQYYMNITGTGFDIGTISLATMAARLSIFPQLPNRAGYTQIFTGPGDLDTTDIECGMVQNYNNLPEEKMSGFIIRPLMGLIRLRNDVGIPAEIQAGALGALGVTLVP